MLNSEPPKIAATIPAQKAVITHGTGPAPEAIDNAIDNGKDTKATVNPDLQFWDNLSKIWDIKKFTNLLSSII